MAFKVPRLHAEYIQKFLELSDDQFVAFLGVLAKAGPQFNTDDLAREVSGRSDLPKELTTGIIEVLTSLYRTKDADGTTALETFIDRGVARALRKAAIFPGEDAAVQWARLRKFFIAALSLENVVGTAAKAGYVLTQHERIFVKARILTDVRPIFHSNVSEKPGSALIIHMLQMTQRDNQDPHKVEDLYFALDSNDISSLKALLDRALQKEETLRALMTESGVAVLYPKATF